MQAKMSKNLIKAIIFEKQVPSEDNNIDDELSNNLKWRFLSLP
jgi:hypothetical protein